MLKRILSFFIYWTKEATLKKQQKRRSTKKHLLSALSWIIRAQNSQKDGGVSAYYTLFGGWGDSFIETTGYIIGSLLKAEAIYPNIGLLQRAETMADFLLKMQLDNGGFKNYPIESIKNNKPVIFNTAQDVIGLCDIYFRTKKNKYLASAIRAADYLLSEQNSDGSWTYGGKSFSYHSRAALALAKVWHFTKKNKYKHAAERNLQWTLAGQNSNFSFNHNKLYEFPSEFPITHTIAYTLEGLLYTSLIFNDQKKIEVAINSVDSLKGLVDESGNVAALFDTNWRAKSSYQCLTGNAQIADLFFHIYELTKKTEYKQLGIKINQRLKELQPLASFDSGIKGGVAGSYPIMGDILKRTGYCRGAILNWSTKFFIDSLISELRANGQTTKNKIDYEYH